MLPVDAMALWPQDSHAMAEGLLFEERLLVLLVPDVLLHDILFYTLRLLGVFSAGLKDRVHLLAQAIGQHTLRLLARHTRLLTLPEPSCWPNCTKGGPGGSWMCHRGLGFGPCPCTHPRSRSREGCQCPCRGADSSLHTAL